MVTPNKLRRRTRRRRHTLLHAARLRMLQRCARAVRLFSCDASRSRCDILTRNRTLLCLVRRRRRRSPGARESTHASSLRVTSIAPFLPLPCPGHFLTLLHELANVHLAVALENKDSAPGPMDDSSSSQRDTRDDSTTGSTSAAELAESQAHKVTASCCLVDELLRARWRRALASAGGARGRVSEAAS